MSLGKKGPSLNRFSEYNPHNRAVGGLLFLRTFGLLCLIVVLYFNLNIYILKITKLLADGDMESNLGPSYSLLKTISGSFHQGHPKFGKRAGAQCACNALFAIWWATVRKISIWESLDLDSILNYGDQLYKQVNKPGLISVEDLPNSVDTGNTVQSFVV